eukprot:TRINITY_DN17549_c0_g1_i4.p1 TRINITY_DN17549_c0_g1~~TRINITY_DN17549_c0_g1_i4.p1  ORF type:complete len:767 (+),score=143.99 TRINITY_DN17549_c0_g1_i4:228-2528(+)
MFEFRDGAFRTPKVPARADPTAGTLEFRDGAFRAPEVGPRSDVFEFRDGTFQPVAASLGAGAGPCGGGRGFDEGSPAAAAVVAPRAPSERLLSAKVLDRSGGAPSNPTTFEFRGGAFRPVSADVAGGVANAVASGDDTGHSGKPDTAARASVPASGPQPVIPPHPVPPELDALRQQQKLAVLPVRCPSCGTAFGANAAFCRRCGESRSETTTERVTAVVGEMDVLNKHLQSVLASKTRASDEAEIDSRMAVLRTRLMARVANNVLPKDGDAKAEAEAHPETEEMLRRLEGDLERRAALLEMTRRRGLQSLGQVFYYQHLLRFGLAGFWLNTVKKVLSARRGQSRRRRRRGVNRRQGVDQRKPLQRRRRLRRTEESACGEPSTSHAPLRRAWWRWTIGAEWVHCAKCGNKIAGDASFCPHCGLARAAAAAGAAGARPAEVAAAAALAAAAGRSSREANAVVVRAHGGVAGSRTTMRTFVGRDHGGASALASWAPVAPPPPPPPPQMWVNGAGPMQPAAASNSARADGGADGSWDKWPVAGGRRSLGPSFGETLAKMERDFGVSDTGRRSGGVDDQEHPPPLVAANGTSSMKDSAQPEVGRLSGCMGAARDRGDSDVARPLSLGPHLGTRLLRDRSGALSVDVPGVGEFGDYGDYAPSSSRPNIVGHGVVGRASATLVHSDMDAVRRSSVGSRLGVERRRSSSGSWIMVGSDGGTDPGDHVSSDDDDGPFGAILARQRQQTAELASRLGLRSDNGPQAAGRPSQSESS